MTQKNQGPIKIHITGQSAFPGNWNESYIFTQEPRPNILQRALGYIGNAFANLLPDKGGKATVTDDSLVIKTSPTIWEYEMFRMEWDRRSILYEMEEIMREDPRIKRANRVSAATAVRKGMTVTVTSNANESLAEHAQDIINGIMHDCQINAKLASWARILPKEGDLFLNPVIDVATKKIKNIKRLPAVSMQRNDDMMGEFQDLIKAFRQIDPITLQIIDDFPLWAVNHIRWDHEEGMRYGNSQYLQIRGYWKKLRMTEEDLVVRRKTRAIPRRLHIVGTKDNPGGWAQVEDYKAKNQLNARTSQITTDYYGNGLTDIKNLDGDAQLDHIKDIEHLQEVYAIGTGVPLHMLGFGRNVNRDIVEDQIKQFKEDTQELRDLLEYGDSSPYSGLRSIFDFGLVLQGIDPSLVDYNISWYADDNETADERVDRVIKLRSAQPKPLVSQKRGMQILAKDLGLENETAVESEREEIENELAQDKVDQQTLENALNPENPSTSPLSHATVLQGLTDSALPASKKKQALALRSRDVGRFEGWFALEIRRQAKKLWKAIKPDIEKWRKKFENYTTAEQRKLIIGDVVNAVREALDEQRESRESGFLKFYGGIAAHARENTLRETELPEHYAHIVTDRAIATSEQFVNPQTTRYFNEQAGTRIRNIDETTLKAVREQLGKSYSNGETFPKWVERIKSVVDCDKPAGRAEMIARTELSWAYNDATRQTLAEIGVERCQVLAVMDNRTCEQCAEAHEQIFTLAEAESIAPRHPRCRCVLIGAGMESSPVATSVSSVDGELAALANVEECAAIEALATVDELPEAQETLEASEGGSGGTGKPPSVPPSKAPPEEQPPEKPDREAGEAAIRARRTKMEANK